MNKNFNHFCDSANDEQEYPKNPAATYIDQYFL